MHKLCVHSSCDLANFQCFFLFLLNTISKFQSCKHFIFNISLCNKSTYDVCECVFIFLLALVSQGASEKQNNISLLMSQMKMFMDYSCGGSLCVILANMFKTKMEQGW